MYTFDKKNHVHKYGEELLTGTTTALSVLKPELTWWASGLACSHMGWFNENKNSKGYVSKETGMKKLEARFEELKKLSSDDYFKELNLAYKAHSVRLKDAGKKGTSTHSLIEDYIHSKIERIPYALTPAVPDFQKRQVQEFIEWADANVKEFKWSEACTFSKKYNVGGICDFGYVDMHDRLMIGDIKTGSDIYENYFIQLGAYDIQLSENGGYDHKGNKLFSEPRIEGYTVVNLPKEGTIKVAHSYNGEIYRQGFLSALYLYRLLKKD